MEKLVALQEGYAEFVEPNDSSTAYDLKNIVKKYANFKAAFDARSTTDESGEVFMSQLKEVTSNLDQTLATFETLSKTDAERKQVFSNFTAAEVNSEYLTDFKGELLQHLSNTIVVKENRQRYQKEQFERHQLANSIRILSKQASSLEEFCVNYSRVIEEMIEQSNNYSCPKIQANYDDFGDQTVRPLNATIFYYFFSADKTKRMLAKWMLATAKYPNEKVRRAYTKFFA